MRSRKTRKINIRRIIGDTIVPRVDSHLKCKFCIKTERCMEDHEWDAATLT